jgi:hypothetical protein
MLLATLLQLLFVGSAGALGRGVLGNGKSVFAHKLFATSTDSALSLGAPQSRPASGSFSSSAGVKVDFQVKGLDNPQEALDSLVTRIDNELGVLLTSSYEVS